MKPVIFLNSHPIQYFAPLYQQIVATTHIPLAVWYCSDESVKGKMDNGFGTEVKWDIPLLEGYKSIFLKNHSWKPSIHRGFFGLINIGVIRMLFRQPKSVIIVHGWAYFTNVLVIVFGKIFGHTICLRSETPLNQEKKKSIFNTSVKYVYLRFLFLFIQRYLYIGMQNKAFYSSLGVKDNKLLFAPYCVDNKRFRQIHNTVSKPQAREKLQLPDDKKIILYSGKYITKKRPMDLLRAFHQLNDPGTLLVFVGGGELRGQMESYISENKLSGNVLLTGFVNQTEIPLYYCAADVFVMCSGLGETWGLSVNEAMNFGLPVIVSDTCGCAYDIVEEGKSGAVFATGEIDKLALLLKQYLSMDETSRHTIEKNAFRIIDQYNYDAVIRAIEKIPV